MSAGRIITGKGKVDWRLFWLTLQECSAQALPIVGLISFLTGLILAFVGAIQLKQFGAGIYVANLVAVAMAREKSDALKEVYKNRDGNQVRYEYLQMKVNTKNGPHDPGDRVVRLVFTAPAADGEPASKPLAVIVNLTKEIVAADAR